MANTYTYIGPGTRWAEGNPTAQDLMNISRINAAHLHEALNAIISTSAADGTFAASIVRHPNNINVNLTIAANNNGMSVGKVSIAAARKVTVSASARWVVI